MTQDVWRFFRNCDVCGRSRIWRDRKKGMLKLLPVPNRIWEEIFINFVMNLPKPNGCKNLLVITNRLGKGTIFIPV